MLTPNNQVIKKHWLKITTKPCERWPCHNDAFTPCVAAR